MGILTTARRKRLLTIAAIGLALIFGAVAYIQFWIARPIGSGPAGPAVPRELFETTWSQRPVLLLGIGDSITAGLGADRPDRSYFERLLQNPPDEFEELQDCCLTAVLPNITAKNIAVSGSNSLEHLRAIEAFPEQPEEIFGLVVLTTGGNDLIHSYGRLPPREGAMYGATLAQAEPWIANFDVRLNTMLDLINARFPGGCQIYLADIYDPTDGVGDAPSVYLPHWRDGLAIHDRYNRLLSRKAEERANVTLVPLYQIFLGHGSHCRQFWRRTYRREDPYYWFYSNIEDPNDRGYDAIRRGFLNAILDTRRRGAMDL